MRIALMQDHPCHDLDACFERLDSLAARAKSEGATLLVTPEMWLGGYNIPVENLNTHAAQFDGITDTIGQLAARHEIALVIGCAVPGDTKPYNAAIAFDHRGQVVARYAKCHLFGDLDQSRFMQGDSLSEVFDLAGLRVGLAICYDIEFPETARTLALRGAQVILVPTANMEPYHSINHRLVPARAEENGVFVAYANLCGCEEDLTYCGLSCLCDPEGATIAIADADPALLVADIDISAVNRVQKDRPFLTDRRAALYFTKEEQC